MTVHGQESSPWQQLVRKEWSTRAIAPSTPAIETRIAWYEPRARLVPRAAYAGIFEGGEPPYLPLWSYASPSSVTRYVLVAHSSCVLDVKPVGL